MNRAIIISAAIAALLAVGQPLQAQPKTKLLPSTTVKLYPEGQGSDRGLQETQGPLESNGLTGDEVLQNNGNLGNIGDDARMDLYFPKKPNGQMVVVCPGGGYSTVSSYNEGVYVAEWMLQKGITVCVVKYRMPNGHWQVPLTDVQNAFRYCRAHASEWNVDNIGVMGFSAGGHLAACASTMFTDDTTRPDFTVLVYPVITFDLTLTHKGTRFNLIGKDEIWEGRSKVGREQYAAREQWKELINKYSVNNNVNLSTPPTYIVLCQDDKTVPAENSLIYYKALLDNNVPAEMHIFPTGGHGWGFSKEKYVGKKKDRFAYARKYFEQTLERWLQAQNNN